MLMDMMASQPLLRFVEDRLATVLDLWPRRPAAREAALARRLIDDLDKLVQAPDRGEGSEFWQRICRELHDLAISNDSLEFMRWPAIRATMVHGASPTTMRFWRMLRRSPHWKHVWKPALRHRQYGAPPPFLPMLSTNAMAIEHAAHLFRFRQHFGKSLLDADCIIELGGGFGSMCRTARALGFCGRYVIFDLPPVLALQRFYLGLHGIDAESEPGAPVWSCSDLDRIIALVNEENVGRIGLISTWALSEMPLTLRERIEPVFAARNAVMALLAYQPEFEGNDNRAYFRAFVHRNGQPWKWTPLPVDPAVAEPFPNDSLYLFGIAR
jgi:hypothetical protein